MTFPAKFVCFRLPLLQNSYVSVTAHRKQALAESPPCGTSKAAGVQGLL